MNSREAFEAWHGGLYRGHQEEIAYAAWQAAIQHARDVAEDCIEHELGETGQAKAIVFAIKEALK